MPEQLLVTIEEAGKMIRVGRTRMYELVAARTIPAVRIGRSVRVPVDALREWISSELAGDAPPVADDRNTAGKQAGERNAEKSTGRRSA